jgi:hypothetical protein
MPNFHIPEMIRDHLMRCVQNLANRPVHLALGTFPLTVEQIQGSVLSQTQIDRMTQLSEEGIQTIEKHSELRLALLRDSNLPGIRRSTVVYLSLPKSIFVGRATMYSISTTKFDVNENHYLIPDFSNLHDTAREELCAWVDKCVRQERLRKIVIYCAAQVLREHAQTTSHLHALWPELATLVDPDDPTVYTHQKAQYRKWVERMRNPVRRNLAAYKPAPEVKERFGRMIQAANVHLAAGMVLNDYAWKRGQIRSFIEHWEHLDGDLHLPG